MFFTQFLACTHKRFTLLACGLLPVLLVVPVVLMWRAWRDIEQEKRDRALIIAIEADDLQAVYMSLRNGASPNARQPKNYQAYSSLWQALSRQLWQHSKQTQWGDTAVFVAMQDGVEEDADVLLALVRYGTRTDVVNAEGETPLAVAAEYGRDRMLRALLKRGTNINMRCLDGSTALMRAAWVGRESEVNLLLDRGADAGLHDNAGNTAITGMMEDTPHKDRILTRLQHAGARK